jgi:hypothetical protein
MTGYAVLLVALWPVPSALAATTAADERNIPKLAPPYAELPPTFWEQHGSAIIVIGIVLLALAALGVWLGLRRKPVEIVPPEARARNELKALQALPEDGAVLSKVSQALRRYFIAAFELPPEEFTTAEFCRVISGNEQIGAELSAAAAEFLRDCDTRKFSATPIAPSGAVARALDLVERGEAQRRPSPPANP